MYVRSNRIQLS